MTTQAAKSDALTVPTLRARRTPGEWLGLLVGRVGLHATLLLITLVWMVPTVGLLVTSIRPKGDILGSGWWTILAHPSLTLANYENVLSAGKMGQAFVNSLYITIPATLLPVLIASLAAFAFAHPAVIVPGVGARVGHDRRGGRRRFRRAGQWVRLVGQAVAAGTDHRELIVPAGTDARNE